MARRLSAIITSGLGLEERDSSPPAPSPRKTSPPAASRSRSPAKLVKPAPAGTQARRSSRQHFLAPEPAEPTLPSLQTLQQHAASNGDEAILMPPPSIGASGYHSRNGSEDRSGPGTPGSPSPSRPWTPVLNLPDQPPVTPISPGRTDAASTEKDRKKRWWSKKDKKGGANRGPIAWIAGHPERLPYDVEGLMSARPMHELWNNEDGDCLIYLFPRITGKTASFKVDSAIFGSSPILAKLAFGDIYSSEAVVSGGDRRQIPLERRAAQLSLHDPSTPPISPKRGIANSSSSSSRDSRGRRYSDFSDSRDSHLYLPMKLRSDGAFYTRSASTSQEDEGWHLEDLQTLVDYRNFIAFLCGQSLVATEATSSFFAIFMTIAGILESFHFTNVDGSTFGEVANSSFEAYVEELGLADVRTSWERTIEGIVLGERLKSVSLYNEAFTHAAGKHQYLVSLKSPKFDMITPVTRNRLTRAAMDLDKRVASITLIMTDFEFPFLFSGIMSSRTSVERKEGVRFDAWKEHFLGMRKFMLGLLKHRYGDWPPKASSKKNTLETSGLNRVVLREVYRDLSSLYDLLVDRDNLTSRTIDGVNASEERDIPLVRGLRAVLSEYDRSTPPVKPPVPFDLPKLPRLTATRSDFGSDAKKDSKALHKKVKDDEIHDILHASWNRDAPRTPFLDAFCEMEKRAAHGRNILEVEDLRIGQWIFMYVVLQALPMLAVDAPGLKWTQAVEYFLCEAPRSGVPWADPNAAGAGAGRRTWFSVGGPGGGVVSLPADLVEHGVEGIYHRSHCWKMAEKWCASNPILSDALHSQQGSGGAERGGPGLPAAPSGHNRLRPDSWTSTRGSNRLSLLGLGLEALPFPAGVAPDGSAPSASERPRTPAHSVDTSKTFDSILADVDRGRDKKKK